MPTVPRNFEIPQERNVRPTSRQSHESAHSTATRADQANSTTRSIRREWQSHYPLTDGMTAKEIAQTFAACTLAVIVGNALLQCFAWCVGHFMKGWW